MPHNIPHRFCGKRTAFFRAPVFAVVGRNVAQRHIKRLGAFFFLLWVDALTKVNKCRPGLPAGFVAGQHAMRAQRYPSCFTADTPLHDIGSCTGRRYPHPEAAQLIVPKKSLPAGRNWFGFNFCFGQLHDTPPVVRCVPM